MDTATPLLSAALLGLSCGFICTSATGPILAAFVVGEELNVRETLLSFLVFSLGKTAVYTLLAFATALAGQMFFPEGGKFFFFDLSLLFNVGIIAVGIWFLLRKEGEKNKCGSCDIAATCSSPSEPERMQSKKSKLSLFLLGVGYGFTPCQPLFLVLVACAALPLFTATTVGLTFGLAGNVSLTVIFCLIAVKLNSMMKKELKDSLRWIKKLSGVLLILMGIFSIYTQSVIGIYQNGG